jgi:hypothetical protein
MEFVLDQVLKPEKKKNKKIEIFFCLSFVEYVGQMYAQRLARRTFTLLCKEGIVTHEDDMVVRISGLHYNTFQEVDRFISSLQTMVSNAQRHASIHNSEQIKRQKLH